ncbi:Myb_DNA-bind_3 domain-containing protein/DDE_4 domain-containing protein [Cephalotus follicularis]|uniref:Myb_DNA-bind_3 domain-containing protein/DDE_4 domain-containing protein n=1 Tax=Cephalotus follicularis TaxID=3775 RepID=A0A1Q3CK07_CEPFO|nr:Myb_DNA-bind_3 domain-containing protein/DDE_4 domain-containing protein [Cephalotus follicularis]
MWEPHIVNIFCDICIKEIDNGGKPKSHFTKEAWKSLVETFGRETVKAYEYNKLKNKWDQLKKDYVLWRALLGTDTGLGWDSEKRTVDASDDWWKRRITVYCIGAIDGVHIPVCISPLEAIPYIRRKGILTQNVMAACDFDMRFTFCWAGWEGSAHDTRIFYTALRDPTLNFLHPHDGNLYNL